MRRRLCLFGPIVRVDSSQNHYRVITITNYQQSPSRLALPEADQDGPGHRPSRCDLQPVNLGLNLTQRGFVPIGPFQMASGHEDGYAHHWAQHYNDDDTI